MPPTTTTPKVDEPIVETHDELGYELDKPIVVTPEEEVKPDEEKPIEKLATGYGKEEPEEEVKPVETPKEEVKDPAELSEEEKNKKEITETIKDLGAGYDKDKITKFAVENKLSKAQLDAYVKMTKDEDAAYVKQQEESRKTQRKVWKEELMKDPEFGGDNFDKNVDRVERLLENMPNTKKVLTEKGTMLPPYIMKDFLSLAKALNPTTTLVVGDAPAPKEEEGDFYAELYK